MNQIYKKGNTETDALNPKRQKEIGAELNSVFKNRDYKIYSNIVTAKVQHNPKKILLIIGVAHIGSLISIFRDDPEFELVSANKFLTQE